MRVTKRMQVPIKASIAMPPLRSAPPKADGDEQPAWQAGAPGRDRSLATIPVFPPESAPSDRDRDPAFGGEADVAVPDGASIAAALLASAGPMPEAPLDGGPVALPDLIMPDSLVVMDQDSVAGTLTYATTVSQSGTVSPFGATHWNTFNMTNIVVTPHPAPPPPPAPAPAPGGGPAPPPPPAPPGRFDVTATVSNPITFNVAGGGKTNIGSETDAAITHANFATVASDLTPNMGDLGGRPPRTQFWASDLTVIHEQFHVGERQTFGAAGVVSAQTWLNGQTAGSVADVNALLAQVPGRVIAHSQANMTMPGKEQRAYGAGAPAYLARANAVTARGTAGLYPGAPPPPAPAPAPPSPAPAPAPPPPPSPGGGP
ncbi:MAG TPA: hypothetical protein VF718_07700 [Allosphingosinicella sp.]|jgi:hypothetical protein